MKVVYGKSAILALFTAAIALLVAFYGLKNQRIAQLQRLSQSIYSRPFDFIPGRNKMTQNTDKWSDLIGETIVRDDSDDKNTIKHSDLPEPFRVIGPYTLVTKDYHENRMNIHTDENDRVVRITYG